MDTFELDSDAFYICTEISPQNFVVQKAIQIDKSQLERMVGKFDGKSAKEKATSTPDSSLGTSSAHSPVGNSPSTSALGGSGNSQVPPIPYWFNRECKTRLMMLGPQPQGPPNLPMFPSSSTHFGPPIPAPPVTHEDLKQQLKNQLEYYFSRENLISDRYLKCQMDSEHFVPIAVVAEFRKIRNLTNDVDLIVEALKDSMVVELDENCEKVRAITKRTTIIIREIPEDRREVVEELLNGGPKYTELKYGLNESWYVTFANELDTQLGYVCVQHKTNEITNRRVCARIKAGGPPTSGSTTDAQNTDKGNPTSTISNGENGQVHLRELGQTLSDYGFVPVASFRPGESILRHFQYQSKTCQFAGNSLGYTQPPPALLQTSLADPQFQQANFFYQSNVPTTARNFDEYSTASSNSTHTTASNYNNRSGSSNGGVGGAANYSNQYFESRSSFSNSNEWRGRGSSGGRFQNNHNNQNESNGRQNSGRGSWRGGRNGTVTNGYSNQNPRQSGQQSNWRNEQNGQHNNWKNDQNVPQNNMRNDQNGHHPNNSNNRNHLNGHQSNWKNQNSSHSSNQWWLSNNGENRRANNNSHNNRQNPPVSSSSSSSVSSKYYSPNAVETPTNSGPSTPPPSAQGKQQYNAPTPSDMPTPPVWPAPNFDRRRKSSEASSITITTNTATNTLTPSTPVISSEDFPAFADAPEPVAIEKVKQKDEKTVKENSVGEDIVVEKPKTNPQTETVKAVVAERDNVHSPPAAPAVSPTAAPTPSFAFEENAFPSLPKKVEPVKPPQKPTFR